MLVARIKLCIVLLTLAFAIFTTVMFPLVNINDGTIFSAFVIFFLGSAAI